jgi:putative transposase
MESLTQFNVEDPIGSIFENQFGNQATQSTQKPRKLVDIVAYCLNPNHFHLLLQQKLENGIPKFLHRFGTGYTKYFNHKYKRTGSLFQGTFKAKYIDDNDYLLHVSAYVNLNFKVHRYNKEDVRNFVRTSLEQYTTARKGIAVPKTILEQFANKKEYEAFAEDSLDLMLDHKQESKELEMLIKEDSDTDLEA